MEREVFVVENADHKQVLLVIAEHEPEAEGLTEDVPENVLGKEEYYSLIPLHGRSIVVKINEILTNL